MPKNCVFEDFPATHKLAGAGLVSTVEDYSQFAEMLLNKVKTVSEELNFANQSFFGRYFKRITGLSPTQYRR